MTSPKALQSIIGIQDDIRYGSVSRLLRAKRLAKKILSKPHEKRNGLVKRRCGTGSVGVKEAVEKSEVVNADGCEGATRL